MAAADLALIIVCFIGDYVMGQQKTVTIDKPCTDNQQFILGRDGILYIQASGDRYFKGTCAISLRAEDPKFQCSNLCFSISTLRLNTCDLELNFYDSNVWNFGSAKPSFAGVCKRALPKKEWCTSGTTATVRLENIKGVQAMMVGKYELQMVAKSMCSDDTRKDPIRGAILEEKELELASNQNLLIILSSVLGCLVLCTCLIVLVLVWYIRRHSSLNGASSRNNRRASDTVPASMPDTDYHPIQVEDGNNHDEQMVREEQEHLIKENGVLALNERVWKEPSAPPGDEIALQDRQPPSYCTSPPEYSREESDPCQQQLSISEGEGNSRHVVIETNNHVIG